MIIDINYDSSVTFAPAAFKADIANAVQFLESEFNNPITIAIDVGFGEVDGHPLSAGALGQSTTFLQQYSYGQIQNVLGGLPASDPTSGGTLELPTAEAKALGLLADNGSLDGYVGFNSSSPFNYAGTAVAGSYDFVATVEHEITEVMGRLSLLNAGHFSALDLFRYSGPGVHDFNPAQSAYFSTDGGQTNLDNFNTNPGGDFGDWAGSAGNDAFLAFMNPGVIGTFSPADIQEMHALGYTSPSTTTPPPPPPTPPGILEALTPSQEIDAMYVGYFDRAPDYNGVVFWEGQYTQALGNGQSTDQALTNIANAFRPQPETMALYPFLVIDHPLDANSASDVANVETLVADVYANLLDRTVNAATDLGAQYWVKQLLSNEMGLGQSVLAIANGAQGADAQCVMNKMIVSDYFVEKAHAAGMASTSAENHIVLVGVSADPATVTAAEAKIDSFFHV